jgi:lipopolysaccharide/colanic/teichoic acid biosynthesis glycosyltransferase
MLNMSKKLFDIVFASIGLVIVSVIILIFFIAASISTGQNGIFKQVRIGQYGKRFTIYKLRSMDSRNGFNKVTGLGKFLRKYKIDELPQLFNILIGDMSFVGPRPDLPGYYDALTGADREVLNLKPGITGPASLKYANEEELLAAVDNPVEYNNNVLFPDKVRINLNYQKHRTFWLDIKLIVYTIMGKQPTEHYLQ